MWIKVKVVKFVGKDGGVEKKELRFEFERKLIFFFIISI